MTHRVLVTGAGGPSAVSFMRAVADYPGIELVAGDIDPYAAGLYIVPPNRRHILRRGADPIFVDDLLALCERERIDVVVPTVDFELLPLAKRRGEFEGRGIKLLLAPESASRIALDKWTLVTACKDVCPVPQSAVVDENFSASMMPKPFFIKPRSGAGARGVKKVEDDAGLAGCPRDGSMIAQEYLGGTEYSVDVICGLDATVLAAVVRSRLKIDSGIAVAGRTLRNEPLERYAAAVANRLGITFVANIQFREDAHGTPKLMDVNVRFPGTMPLTVASGVDMPRLALDLLFGKPIERASLVPREIAMMRTWQEQFISPGEIAALEAQTQQSTVS